jgi:hypothetical protein
MSRLRHISIALATAALLAGGGYLSAQGGAADLPEVSIPTEEEIDSLSPAQMRERVREMISAMQGIHERTVELQSVAREARDVIRLNCVNDKLLQVKQLLNIAETSRNDLIEAIAASDDAARGHHFTQVAISYENVVALQGEAEGCVGEETVFLGPTEVQVTGPDIIDDPTAEDPFPDFEIEDPAYASPYF